MKRKRRKRVIAAAGLILAAGGALAYLLLRENPNYVRAAETLPQAKAAAVEAFDTLTWRDYRAERGIADRDDTDAWEAFGKTIPRGPPYTAYFLQPRDDTLHNYFLANRQWYMEVYDRIKDMSVQHVFDPATGQWSRRQGLAISGLRRLLGHGIIGAADAGDAEAVLAISQAAWKLSEQHREELDWLGYLWISAEIPLYTNAIVRAAVRNRDDPQVLQELRTAMAAMPKMPTMAEALAGDVRSTSVDLEELSLLSQDQIDSWLDEYAEQRRFVANMLNSGATRRKQIEFKIEGQIDRIRSTFRGIGPHTKEALEARHWQLAVELYSILVGGELRQEETRRGLNVIERRMDGTRDVSYELAKTTAHISFFAGSIMLTRIPSDIFETDAARVALQLISLYPGYDRLPESLPDDLVFSDQFGGDAIYRKIDSGFLLYSRGEDGIDDGGPSRTITELRQYDIASFGRPDGNDRSLFVCYDPIVPVP